MLSFPAWFPLENCRCVEENFITVLYVQPNINFIRLFSFYGSVYRNNILIYIQQDATLRSLFYLETALHVSGGSITHHEERKQLHLQHLVFVTSAAI
jgi:hypothetical protein